VINHVISKGSVILGVKKIELRVRENNERAIHCYQKCGF
jgi:RimJ/RimL family protein N-acetyltransferase